MKMRNKTKRSQIKPLGVAERLGDAPPSRYVYGASTSTRPTAADTYMLDGPDGQVVHRFDGACHEPCEDVR